MSQQTETKESKWDMPDELLLLLEKVEKEGKGGAQQSTALVYVAPSLFSTTFLTIYAVRLVHLAPPPAALQLQLRKPAQSVKEQQ